MCRLIVAKTAAQGQYALNTVRAVYESVPANILHEIIVVDDGSEPPLAESFLTRDVVNVYKVTIIRHVRASDCYLCYLLRLSVGHLELLLLPL